MSPPTNRNQSESKGITKMMQKLIAGFAVVLAGLIGFAGNAAAQCDAGTIVGDALDGQPGTITTSTVWGAGPNPSPICLEEPIFVVSGAVLTIAEGTIVRGQPRRGAPGVSINRNAGALIVTRGAQLIAEGTSTSPIVMTTAAVDNDGDGACDNFDANSGVDGSPYPDFWPGFDPADACATTDTCLETEPDDLCTSANGCTPVFCDANPLSTPLAPLDSNGNANVELWGGLSLQGRAPVNTANNEPSVSPTGLGEDAVEGIILPDTPIEFASYGGLYPHDSSGVVKYVSVRHAGDPLVADQELNGVTIAGVGDGTVYSYVEVFCNWDDGHEWFGGTVNGDHLVTFYAGDDQFDMDQGFTGALQFLYAHLPFFNQDSGASYGSSSGDRIGEWDGVDGDDVVGRQDTDDTDEDTAPQPFPYTQVWNLTGVGATTDGTNPATSPNGVKRGITARNGFGGATYNNILVNNGTGVCFEVATDGASDAPSGYAAQDNVANDLIRIAATHCGDSTGGINATASANGEAWAAFQLGDNSGDNVVSGDDYLVVEDPSFDPKGNSGLLNYRTAGGITPQDPRPTGSAATATGLVPRDSRLDASATYRGAFEPGAAELWTTPWTAAYLGGIIEE